MNLKAISEKLETVLNTVKSSFADDVADDVTGQTETTEETAESVETKFAEVTLMDGETVLSYDGELAEGTQIFIVAEGEQIPAPEGTHELGGDMAGVSIVVDADGVIAEVIDAREESSEDVESEEMSEETPDMNAIIDEKMSEISEPLNKIVDGIDALVKENSALRNELNELKSEFNEFKQSPSVTEEETTKFSRTEKISGRQKYLQNLRKK